MNISLHVLGSNIKRKHEKMPTGVALSPAPLQRNRKYQFDGTKSYVYLMEKWGFEPTIGKSFFQGSGDRTGNVRRVQRRQGENVQDLGDDDIQSDSLFQCEVWIGTPPQKFWMDLDTCSADTWVWSNRMSQDVLSKATHHTAFDPSRSSTFKDLEGAKWETRYGSRTWGSGTVGTDTLAIGGFRIENQAIQLAEHVHEPRAGADGSLGLAYSNLSTIEPVQKTPLENMLDNEHARVHDSQRLFTMKLGAWSHKREIDHNEGFFTFGFVDYDLVAASEQILHYAPVDHSKGLWQIKSKTFAINGQPVERSTPNNTAVIDSNTPLVLISDDAVKAIYDRIPGAKFDEEAHGYVFPQDVSEEQLPVVGFEVEGKLYPIAKEDLGFSVTRSGFIYGGIQSRGNLPMDIYGETFLKSVYAIFDLTHNRIGVVSRPDLKPEIETLPDHAVGKKSFFHKLMYRLKNGMPEDMADRDTGFAAKPLPASEVKNV